MSGKTGKARDSATDSSTLESARRVIDIEMAELAEARDRLGTGFERAVELVAGCTGKVIVAGMGKSGQIARKLAATLSSTGTPAMFLHAAEAGHGDQGIFMRNDICIALSYSGTTNAVVDMLENLKRLSIPMVAITGGLDSPLAEAADALLDASVTNEACPLGLAPTASTTVALALGDALAVAVLERKGFGEDDFALLHPGGALGRRLLRVSDLMHGSNELPSVGLKVSMHGVVEAITDGGLGTVAVVDDDGRLVGVVTDGDIRRAVLANKNPAQLCSADVMTVGPRTVSGRSLAAEALAMMEQHTITSLFITNEDDSRPVGVVHLHDLLRSRVA